MLDNNMHFLLGEDLARYALSPREMAAASILTDRLLGELAFHACYTNLSAWNVLGIFEINNKTLRRPFYI
jgi:hypothetical protein